MRLHCPPDTGFEIRALAVWGRARYLSVTEAPHNTDFYTWIGKKHLCFFQTAETGNRAPNSSVKGSGANHYHRAPALFDLRWSCMHLKIVMNTAFRDKILVFQYLCIISHLMAQESVFEDRYLWSPWQRALQYGGSHWDVLPPRFEPLHPPCSCSDYL